MKLKYAVVQGDSIIGYVYDSDKLGMVVVLDRQEIELNSDIEVYNITEGKVEDKLDVLELLLSHLGIKIRDEL